MNRKIERKRSENPVNLETVAFQIRESYKTARTNIVYSIIKKGCKKVAFTSSNKGEGKTVTSINVAIALAQQVNTRVLIVDCDLRRPQVHNVLSIAPSPGITNYLNGECTMEEAIRKTNVENLYAVTYGAVPPNPSELLACDDMHDFIKSVEKDFDFVIFDNPPVGVVVDSIPIIKQSDGVVLVVKHNQTTYPNLKKIVDTLNRNGGKILGIIVNGVETVKVGKSRYGASYGYYE